MTFLGQNGHSRFPISNNHLDDSDGYSPFIIKEDLRKHDNLRILPRSELIHELQTIIHDVTTTRSNFKFVADRLIRCVIEEGLNLLPYTEVDVTTPTGQIYHGLRYEKGNCGVSIVRSGEAMEKALRDCCRSITIGKILLESYASSYAADNDNAIDDDIRVIYAKLPEDISSRKVLLLYPIINCNIKVRGALNVLLDHGVPEEHIILISLFCSPEAVKKIILDFPRLKVLTTELDENTPNHFGQTYFGTDNTDY